MCRSTGLPGTYSSERFWQRIMADVYISAGAPRPNGLSFRSMILQCPSCNARFLVADALVPPLGRTVRCGACSFQWFVEPTRVETVESARPEMPPVAVDFATLAEQASLAPGDAVEPRHLPVLSSRLLAPKPYRIAALALAASWLIVAAIAYFPRGAGLAGDRRLLPHRRRHRHLRARLQRHLHAARRRRRQDAVHHRRRHHQPRRRAPPRAGRARPAEGQEGAHRLGAQLPGAAHGECPASPIPFRISDVKTSFADSVAAIVLDLGNALELAVR
ncbi:MAG: zinc-ribbon domain-containing protein [Alphaproteobacteria bacterium]